MLFFPERLAAALVITETSSRGPATKSSPFIFAKPALANGATEYTLVFPFIAALRSRKNTIGDSSSGSNPTNSTLAAASKSP